MKHKRGFSKGTTYNNWIYLVSRHNRLCGSCGNWIYKGEYNWFNTKTCAEVKNKCVKCHNMEITRKTKFFEKRNADLSIFDIELSNSRENPTIPANYQTTPFPIEKIEPQKIVLGF